VAIPPTPTVGAVGLLPDYGDKAGFGGLKPGDTLVLIGETHGELGSSLYLRELFGREDGAPPPVDLAVERRNGDFVRALIQSGRVTACHDISDGGLAIALAEMAMAGNCGARIAPVPPDQAHGWLFGEEQARYVLTCTAEHL